MTSCGTIEDDTAAVECAAGGEPMTGSEFLVSVTHRFAEMTDHRYDSQRYRTRRVLSMINSGKKERRLVRRLSRR